MAAVAVCLAIGVLPDSATAGRGTCFRTHTVKPPRPGPAGNTVPSMVWLEDINRDGYLDLLSTHTSWQPGFVHPYTAWYEGPEMSREHVIIDRTTVGKNSRIYRFVLFDVDGDGRKDLIGQGYQPNHNGNHWYRCPEDPSQPWHEAYDYGRDLKNGHDLALRDIDDDGQMDLVLLDSWHGTIIVKPIPAGEAAKKKWPFYQIVEGDGFTHYMSFYDVNGDALEDIVIGREEDGGEGIKWYEHPGNDQVRQEWRKHFETRANFTKVLARDLDGDGDVDFVGTGEITRSRTVWDKVLDRLPRLGLYRLPTAPEEDVGWYERLQGQEFAFHEIDVEENGNEIVGGHNCELVDVDGDGDEDLLVGGVDVRDLRQRLRYYEYRRSGDRVAWSERPIAVTSAPGWEPGHGYYCGEMAWGDIDNDGDRDLAFAGVGSGFLGWFERIACETAEKTVH